MGKGNIAIKGDLAVIHYKGNFDLEGLYRIMKAWFDMNQYDFYENLHKAKKPELELEWRAEKKISGYIKHHVEISFHFWGLKEVEAIIDGKKKQMNHARFFIRFKGSVQTDYEGSWEVEKSSLRAKLKHFYETYIIRRELEANQYDELVIEIRELQDKTKEFLGMEGV